MHPDTIIGALIIGLFIGALARLVVPGKQDIGILMTIVVGLVGTFIGLFIGAGIGSGRVLTFILEVAVGAALVWLMSAFGARTATRSRRHV
jgi:uncharacterized membrane protein YeaQ/YmgE (transglycosylase-associated protein family)